MFHVSDFLFELISHLFLLIFKSFAFSNISTWCVNCMIFFIWRLTKTFNAIPKTVVIIRNTNSILISRYNWFRWCEFKLWGLRLLMIWITWALRINSKTNCLLRLLRLMIQLSCWAAELRQSNVRILWLSYWYIIFRRHRWFSWAKIRIKLWIFTIW